MSRPTIEEGTILWEPTAESISRATITKYINWLESEQGLIRFGKKNIAD